MSVVDGPSNERWGDLRRTPPESIGQFAASELRVDGVRTGIFMALGHDHSLHLCCPLADDARPIPATQLNGLELHQRRIVLAGSARLYLDLESTPAFEGMFTVVAREVAQAVAVDGVASEVAAAMTIRRWQSFWRAPRTGDLTRAQQLGLFGEVWWLHRQLIGRLGAQAVLSWTGPNGERHDFQGPTTHLEVKVTERQASIFTISGLEQLDAPEDRRLGLATLMVREEQESSDGLVQEVRACERTLDAHPAELTAFRDKLAAVGYRRERETAWDQLRLRVRSADVYLVDADFPKLVASGLVGGRPAGLVDVQYDIDLIQIAPLESEERDALLRGLR